MVGMFFLADPLPFAPPNDHPKHEPQEGDEGQTEHGVEEGTAPTVRNRNTGSGQNDHEACNGQGQVAGAEE